MTKRGIVLYLHVHQPYRVRKYSVFDTANKHDYFDDPAYDSGRNNEQVFRKVADKSYRPMMKLLEKMLNDHPDFKVSMSITGTFLEQAESWGQDIIDNIKRLVDTGRTEIVAETYYHSLAFFFNRSEFE
ncbi:alpha-amylase, partial [Candidatus Saccharibacteria bacterium]|nr:alpha-amylase [Candidatus Saccharibacteria bacterium]